MNKAVFLDRDGVINRKVPVKDFVKNTDELVYLPNVKETITSIKKQGYLVIIISNQSGINRGIIKKEDLDKINGKLKNELHIDAFYYCPHLPDENCPCRKPKTGLIEQAVKDFNIDVKSSFFIGDNDYDMKAGQSAGCKTIIIDGDIGISQINSRINALTEVV